MRSLTTVAAILVTGLFTPSSAAGNAPETKARVLVISIDGLGYQAFQAFRHHAPVLDALAKQGWLGSAETIFPSMTWPSHASLVTGCRPSKHGIIGNRVLLRSTGKVQHASTVRYADAFKVQTLFDLAHAQGLRSAAIFWPSTREASAITFNIPEVYGQRKFDRWSSKAWLRALSKAGLPTHRLGKFSEDQMFLQDTFARDAAIELMRSDPPELMMVHFLSVDSLGHSFGPSSRPYRWGLELVDRYVGDLLAALKKHGIHSETSVFIVSDHGFLTIRQRFDADKLLHRAGYIKSLRALSRGPLHTVSNGHALYVYFPKGADAQMRRKVAQLFGKQAAIERVYFPRDYHRLSLPKPKGQPSAPDLIVLSRPDTVFGRIKKGEAILASKGVSGMHGYSPTHPEMRSLFIAAGPKFVQQEVAQNAAVRPNDVWLLENIDMAPTIARLLGLKFNAPIDGHALNELFEP